jgi:putative ABC transport system substrate-binding protein
MRNKLFIVFMLVLVAVFLGVSVTQEALAQKKNKIGFLPFTGESRYVLTNDGVIAQLKKEGIDEQNTVFDFRNAEGKKEKVTEITKEFIEKGMDVIVTYGTSAVGGAYKETKDIPIVFGMVYDPVGAGVAKSIERSGTNVTGASNFVAMKSVVQIVRRVAPGKKIGVLYTEGERNSVIQLEGIKNTEGELGVTIISANVIKSEEVGDATLSLIQQGVDSIFVTGSSVVDKNVNTIVEVANAHKIPTVTHLPDRVEKGILLSLSADAFTLGELAGKQISQILKGTKPTDIPIEILKNYDITINMKTAKAIGKTISPSLLKIAKKVIE